jgi:hypothetical protein
MKRAVVGGARTALVVHVTRIRRDAREGVCHDPLSAVRPILLSPEKGWEEAAPRRYLDAQFPAISRETFFIRGRKASRLPRKK